MCFRIIVGLGAVISILLALAMLGITIYANVNNKQIITNIEGNQITMGLVALYIGASIFLILGICGLYGVCKIGKNQAGSSSCGAKCLLLLYFIGIVVFFLAFIAGSIFFMVVPKTFFNGSCSSGQNSYLTNLYDVSKNASQIFCNTSCSCYINPTNVALRNYIEGNGGNTSPDSASPRKYSECANITRDETSFTFLGTLQSVFQCQGWCKDTPGIIIFRFTDVNSKNCQNGTQCFNVSKPCYVELQNFLTQKGQLVGFGCIGGTIICCVIMISICALWFCGDKEKRSRNFYQRMYD